MSSSVLAHHITALHNYLRNIPNDEQEGASRRSPCLVDFVSTFYNDPSVILNQVKLILEAFCGLQMAT